MSGLKKMVPLQVQSVPEPGIEIAGKDFVHRYAILSQTTIPRSKRQRQDRALKPTIH